jgi:peptidoglycan/xylan/chitin deacetylase (PgdA/CDA1 family)
VSYRALLRRAVTRSRRPRRDGASPLAILLYHAVVRRTLEIEEFCFIREEEFRRQIDALRRRFRVVSLEEGSRLLAAGELNEPTVALTFDDGFQDNFEVAYPVLAAARVPATIFVCTDLLDTGRALWFCRLHEALTRTTRAWLDWNDRRYDLAGVPARTRAANTLKAELKRLAHPELGIAVDEIVRVLLPQAHAGDAADPRFRLLTRAAMREMSRDGLVDLGAHTGSHAILSKLSPAEQRDEIERSIREVSAVTERPCRLFAYPNGTFDDYDSSTVAILRQAGITVAVTAEKGLNDRDTPPLELLRYAIGGEPSMPSFEAVLRRVEKATRSRS